MASQVSDKTFGEVAIFLRNSEVLTEWRLEIDAIALDRERTGFCISLMWIQGYESCDLVDEKSRELIKALTKEVERKNIPVQVTFQPFHDVAGIVCIMPVEVEKV